MKLFLQKSKQTFRQQRADVDLKKLADAIDHNNRKIETLSASHSFRHRDDDIKHQVDFVPRLEVKDYNRGCHEKQNTGFRRFESKKTPITVGKRMYNQRDKLK